MRKLLLAFAVFAFTSVSVCQGAAIECPDNSAVPTVEVHSDDAGDFVYDTPFPQWVRREVPSDVKTVAPCDAAADIAPDWVVLPVAPVKCFAVKPSGEELWGATSEGVVFIETINNNVLYFGAPRWLPDNDVTTVEVTESGDALVKTAGGDVILAREMMSLEDKALMFEEVSRARHNRNGMRTDSGLKTAGDLSTWFLTDDDNDGQWSEMFLAAESFRYAVTGDEQALENARETFQAMKTLLTIAPVKGYPARSVLPADKCPGSDPHNWRMTESGDYCWKSDTSVDELVGHYFGLPVFYDLVANEAEKEEVRTLIRDLTDYILDNGLRIVNESGDVTSDGNWDPEWVNTVGRTGDQGLNSAQALNAMRAAHHITGDQKYLDKYIELIKKHDYHKNVQKEKEISDRFQVNHDSDEMAFISFYNLVKYENNKGLWEKFLFEGLRRAWANDLPERNPEQIVIYGAFAKKDFGLADAIRTLQEIPLDLVKWPIINSHRKDLHVNKDLDRFGNKQNLCTFPYTEARTMRWSVNMRRLEIDASGHGEADTTFWLLPYWMARYHGMIRTAEGE